MGPSIAAGARAFVGSFTNLPGDSYQFFLPATDEPRPIPGVWIGRRDGVRLHAWLAEGPVRIRLAVDSTSERVRSFNVVGELPGADDQVVMVNSHHDGPWASAVEDGSGIALVLAQASYWAAQPPERRPHRLVFLLQAGHMEAGAGMAAYIEAHRAELDDVVLQVTLEHAARDCVEGDDGHGGGDGEGAGRVVVTDRPVPRWFFTSRIPHLERAVVDAVTREGLDRSLLLAPNAIGPHPQSDGGYYYYEGVPLMHYITAPWYLFDAQDTLDKIDRPSLVPVTRATIRVVASTAGISAAKMRSADLRNG
jgi:hypothetical protein